MIARDSVIFDKVGQSWIKRIAKGDYYFNSKTSCNETFIRKTNTANWKQLKSQSTAVISVARDPTIFGRVWDNDVVERNVLWNFVAFDLRKWTIHNLRMLQTKRNVKTLLMFRLQHSLWSSPIKSCSLQYFRYLGTTQQWKRTLEHTDDDFYCKICFNSAWIRGNAAIKHHVLCQSTLPVKRRRIFIFATREMSTFVDGLPAIVYCLCQPVRTMVAFKHNYIQMSFYS